MLNEKKLVDVFENSETHSLAKLQEVLGGQRASVCVQINDYVS